MKNWFFLPVIIFLVSLQLTWPGFLSFFNCKPDLLLILSVALVFYLDFQTAFIFAVLAGLTKDLFLQQPFALNTILFCLWSYLTYILTRQISTDLGYVRAAIVLIAAFLTNIITGMIIVNFVGVVPVGIFLRNLIVSSVYTVAITPLIFTLTKKISA